MCSSTFVFLVLIPFLVAYDEYFFDFVYTYKDFNSTRYFIYAKPDKYLSIEKQYLTYSYKRLHEHAHPCEEQNTTWTMEIEVEVLFPCADGEPLHESLYLEIRSRGDAKDNTCQEVREAGENFKFRTILLKKNQVSHIAHTIQIHRIGDDYPSEYPIVKFLYIRDEIDCAAECHEIPIYSSVSCSAPLSFHKDGILCDFEENCSWRTHNAQRKDVNRPLEEMYFLEMNMNRGSEASFVSSPFYSSLSTSCELSLTYLIRSSAGMDIRLHTLNGSIVDLLHISRTQKFETISTRLGYFSMPTMVEIICQPDPKDNALCKLDNIRMTGCEEYNQPVCNSTEFLCRSGWYAMCIPDDRVCDLHQDCPLGEDERNCSVPFFAVCDFEHATDSEWCRGWNVSGESHLMNIQNSSLFNTHGPYNIKNGTVASYGDAPKRAQREGEYLWYNDDSVKGMHHTVSFFSPMFPSFNHNNCTLRFWTCVHGIFSSFQWIVVGGSGGPIWDTRNESSTRAISSDCTWKRVAINIPPQRFSYNLQLEGAINNIDKFMFGLDDVSVSPGCFDSDNNKEPIPKVYSITSCQQTGYLPPNRTTCIAFYNRTNSSPQIAYDMVGIQTWKAPLKKLYRIEACGAAAGKEGGRGGCVVVLINFEPSMKLDILVGQSGEKQCKNCGNSTEGGGGATVITYQGRLLLVAAGGGGLGTGQLREDADGGSEDIDDKRETKRKRGHGRSYSVEDQRTDNDSTFGRTRRGGFGGGGSAYRDIPGGGAGYTGGPPGRGGTSFYYHNEGYRILKGANTGDGYVNIAPCTLKCSKPSFCQFASFDRNDLRMVCKCPKGDLYMNDKCTKNVGTSSWITKGEGIHVLLIFLLFSCFLIIFAVIGKRLHGKKIREELELTPMIEELNKIDRHKIILHESIGKGAFGEVFSGEWQTDGQHTPVAVKILSNSTLSSDFVVEAVLLKKINHKRHPNIVHLFGIDCSESPFYLILELMNAGDLKNFLRNNRPDRVDPPFLGMRDLLEICLDVARGCLFMEQEKYVHRDLAARNCLVSITNNERVVKIGDFGFARDIFQTDYYRKGGPTVIPVRWMPLEALIQGLYTAKTDVWSFGILCWEVFSFGQTPYASRSNVEVIELVRTGGRLMAPHGTPRTIYKTMLECWNEKLEERPTFETIVERLENTVEDTSICGTPVYPGPFDFVIDVQMLTPVSMISDYEDECSQLLTPTDTLMTTLSTPVKEYQPPMTSIARPTCLPDTKYA